MENTKIISQANKGPASATQRGINSSTGDYIKLLGGDDIISRNCTNICNLLEVITKIKLSQCLADINWSKILIN